MEHLNETYDNTHFLTLSNKVEKCLYIRFICLSVCLSVLHALTVVNILQMCLNLYILFISDIEWTGKIENHMYGTEYSFTETHKSFPTMLI